MLSNDTCSLDLFTVSIYIFHSHNVLEFSTHLNETMASPTGPDQQGAAMILSYTPLPHEAVCVSYVLTKTLSKSHHVLKLCILSSYNNVDVECAKERDSQCCFATVYAEMLIFNEMNITLFPI